MINSRKIGHKATRLSLCRGLISLMLVASAMLLVCCGTIIEEQPSYDDTSLVGVGDLAPEFFVATLDGEYVTFGGQSDEPALLILFSHTCPDCKNLLTALQKRLDGGVAKHRIIAVSRGGSESDIAAYRDENRFTFPIAADPLAEVYYKYATMYVPRCYVVDSDGVIRFVTYEYTEGDVAKLFSEMAKY